MEGSPGPNPAVQEGEAALEGLRRPRGAGLGLRGAGVAGG